MANSSVVYIYLINFDFLKHFKTLSRTSRKHFILVTKSFTTIITLRSLKFLKSINKSILEKKFVNYFTSKKIYIDEC